MALVEHGENRKVGSSSHRRGDGAIGCRSASVEGFAMSGAEGFLHRLDNVLQTLVWIPRLMLFVAAVLVIIQAMDREPPFQVLSVEPAFARAGDTVTITAKVKRDTTRNCSASMSRSIFDSDGKRSDYALQKFSDAMIDDMEQRNPGVLRVSVQVPQNANIGTARLVSVLDYRCNRVHALWPIEVTTTLPFEVIP